MSYHILVSENTDDRNKQTNIQGTHVPSVTLFIIGIFGGGIVPLGIVSTVEVVSLRDGDRQGGQGRQIIIKRTCKNYGR